MNSKLLLIVIILSFSSMFIFGQSLSVSINNKPISSSHIVRILNKDTVTLKVTGILKSNSTDLFYWVKLEPTKKYYDNTLLKDRYKNYSIDYEIKIMEIVKQDIPLSICFDSIGPGTTYWGILKAKPAHELFYHSIIPLYADNSNNFVQIVCRSDDSYTGYLSELYKTPFILVPKYIPGYGHQTDLRIGSDCAEFLIYGKRRQGFNIPYCGPRLLKNYLDQINSDNLNNGCIIHFGEQTALLYEDKGIIGKLDDDDLLFQCYYRGPEIIKLKDSEFRHHSYKAYKWKKEFDIYRKQN